MNIVTMSDIAYDEFLDSLKENGVKDNILRIHLAGMGCSGPVFNLVIDEEKPNDEVVKIHDVTFLIDKNLVSQFVGFVIECSEENGLGGFSLEPIVKPDTGGCSTCGGCH
jgi:HesB-like selenoprotein